MKTIAIDSEVTGLDHYHGAMPYFVTVARDDGQVLNWEWPVDPLTRRPVVSPGAVAEVWAELHRAERIVLHNAKFDVTALGTLCPSFPQKWPWHKTEDTLIAGHLLASKQPHDLTSMCIQYLGVDLHPQEDALHEACEKARRLCRRWLPAWQIAAEGRPDMPSAKGGVWKADGWLPRALCLWAAQQKEVYQHPRPRKVRGKWKEAELPWWWEYGHSGHPWLTVLSDYASTDSAGTLGLWGACEAAIRGRKLWKIYRERMRLPAVALDVERRGVTLSRTRLDVLRCDYRKESRAAAAAIGRIAARAGAELVLPKGANNQSLHSFCFDVLNLPVISRTEKTGRPSLDKATFAAWEATVPKGTPAGAFVNALRHKRKRDTAIAYLESYERFGIANGRGEEWLLLHPNLNQTGSETLRWSSSNPNSQNIEKEPVSGRSLRHVFGPAPGREWWSVDAQNIELRIPAYKSGEPLLCEVFDHPERGPYFGSYHLAVFDVLHPELFAKHGKASKDLFAATWYQWVKNGNFAVIYGAQEDTADRAYHVKGAFRKLQDRFPLIAQLNREQIRRATTEGRIWTVPDASVDPDTGYPLDVQRTEWSAVVPTQPLNYYVQGTACWWMARAMVRCHGQLNHWRTSSADRQGRGGYDGFITMQVHDELVFDLPKRADPREDAEREKRGEKLSWANCKSNLVAVRVLQRLMEAGGRDIGVPTPTAAKWHPEDWGEGVTL